MSEKQKQSVGLVWFTKNLRVRDNHSLIKALEENEKVIGVYCFDPRHFSNTKYGFKKTEKFRAKFLIETVENLRKNLYKQNISLLVFHEKPELILSEIIQSHQINSLYCQREWTSEEVDIVEKLHETAPNCNFIEIFDQFLFHPDDIPYSNFSEIPEVFTNFRQKVEANAEVRKCLGKPKIQFEDNLVENDTDIPSLNDLGLKEFELDTRSVFPFSGGEDAAEARLQDYFWETQDLKNYKETRNEMLGAAYSSKFSPWLANGSLSSRYIYEEVKKFESEIVENDSTYWLIFELLWRDYFKYVSLKHGSKIFQLKGISQKDLVWKNDSEALKKWIEGNTKEPFVNANMKEIAATGFMSNRGRQNVNSFWAKELLQDWRVGAAYFESMLIDYDVHSNWGNWMYNSGVGNDPRDRKFNIKKQAERYDADGKFQQTWLK